MVKIRNGFVSNSSSSSFIIINKTEKTLSVKDFFQENCYIIKKYQEESKLYNRQIFSFDEIMKWCEDCNVKWLPNETKVCELSSEGIGPISYMLYCFLGDNGESNSFKWIYSEPESFYLDVEF